MVNVNLLVGGVGMDNKVQFSWKTLEYIFNEERMISF